MSETVNWGIIGAGAIAKAFVKGVADTRNAQVVAVGSRSQEKANAFGAEFGIRRCHGSYESLLADPEVRAVYVATPHPGHAEWTIRAAEAGKAILVEKPIAVNHAQAMAMIEAARVNGVFLMEAFMYRCHPQTSKLVELIRSGAIGDVRVIHAAFSFHAGFHAESRIWKNALAGGGILDVGCYAVSMCRLIAGAAQGRDFADPTHVTGAGKLNPVTGVDEYAVGTLAFDGGAVATIATGVGVGQENVVRVFGSEGSLFIANPWVASRDGAISARIVVARKGQGEPREEICDTPVTSFALEAETASAAILDGRKEPPPPAMTWADSAGNISTLDAWRAAIGLTYEMEKPGNIPTVTGRPLARPSRAAIPSGRIAGLDKPVSRLVVGMDNTPSLVHWSVMLDDFFSNGGNCMDTAYIYGGGFYEKTLGQWIRQRDVRDQVVILDKGAHTPDCHPEALSRQLLVSLDRLETFIDIYIMHRDNPDIPVAEFVDTLNEHVRKGRIRIFGGSNWTTSRIEEANEYACRKGLQGFSVLSNNFSLAHMMEAVWAGCIHSSDRDWREWLTRTQMPLMAWSSQARGFFTERAAPGKTDEKELVRCWYGDDNFKRKERAEQLARDRGVLPIQVALAYVLCQPFPTFPLIGPRTLAELHSSMAALKIALTAEEVKWLSLDA